MKKVTWLISAAAAALLAAGAPVTTLAAGDETDNLTKVTGGFQIGDGQTSTNANSVAQFNIEAGTLALLEVPNLNFGKLPVKDLIDKATTLKLVDGNAKKNADGYDGSANKTIKVSDYRGTNAGWTLTGQLNAFKRVNDATTQLTATSLALTGTTTGDNLTTPVNAANLSGAAADVLAAAKDEGTGTTTSTLTDATLILPQTKTAVAGDYSAAIVWTLNATPQP